MPGFLHTITGSVISGVVASLITNHILTRIRQRGGNRYSASLSTLTDQELAEWVCKRLLDDQGIRVDIDLNVPSQLKGPGKHNLVGKYLPQQRRIVVYDDAEPFTESVLIHEAVHAYLHSIGGPWADESLTHYFEVSICEKLGIPYRIFEDSAYSLYIYVGLPEQMRWYEDTIYNILGL